MGCYYVDSSYLGNHLFCKTPIDIIELVVYVWFALCTFYYIGIHWLVVSKGLAIYNRYSKKTKVNLEDYIYFIFLVIVLYDFYTKGVDDNAFFNFFKNLAIIYERIKEVGVKEFLHTFKEDVVNLMF